MLVAGDVNDITVNGGDFAADVVPGKYSALAAIVEIAGSIIP